MDRSQVASAFVLTLLLALSATSNAQLPPKSFPALFILGDSLVDVGNNNYILTLARANSLPYGIDFPAGPTGRLTNGKTVLDFVADLLQLPLLPPYLAPTTRGKSILQGVNYASAAGGILRGTGLNFIGRIEFDTQLQWLENTVAEVQQLLGVSAAQELLAKSLFVTVIGSNDYINNYLLRLSPSKYQLTPQNFQAVLLNKFSSQLTQLYYMGARNIFVVGLGPLGCIPSQLLAQKSVNGECSAFVNNLVENFNAGLKVVIQKLNAKLTGSNFVYGESYTPVLDFRNNPAAYGLQVVDEACCGGGKYNSQLSCVSIAKVCPDRDAYLFWDAYHPTQNPNGLLANLFYRTLASEFNL